MFTLDQVVPWGRSFGEYRRMFALNEADLQLRILGCADGPASFNAEATRSGTAVVSADPLYRFGESAIRKRIASAYEQVLDQMRRNMHEYVWTDIGSVEELGRVRMETMEIFLADYAAGKDAGRYVDAGLPALPFPDRSFDLAVCSHFLFLYSGQFSEEFHVDAVREMSRVADEVRIFPLLALGGKPSPYLAAAMDALQGEGDVTLEIVPYEFQKGASRMMRIRRR